MWIDYLLIVLSVFCFAAQFAFTKLYEGKAGQSMTATLVMLCTTSLVGALLFLAVGGFQVAFSPISMLWAVILALIMLPYYMIGIQVISLGSLAVYSMFMMLGGMLVPFFYGLLFLGEDPTVGKIAGTVLLTVFIVLQAVGQEDPKGKESSAKTKRLFFILCLVIFFINGLTGVVAKAHADSVGAVSEVSFTATYCALTCVFSLVALLISSLGKVKEKGAIIRNSLKAKPLLVMIFLGSFAYGGGFLQLLAADKVPASVQFPLVSGGVIILSAFVSAFCFREKLAKREWISVAGAFAATFLFAF